MITMKGNNGIYEGLSDERPADVPVNTRYHALDSDKWYFWDGENWTENPHGGGGGFEPTDAQLSAMNSGITTAGVQQIETNKNNILSISNKTKRQSQTFITGYYIKTNLNVGDVVDLTPISDSDWEYCIVDCVAGQQITITANGGNIPRTYAFIDDDNKLLLTAGVGTNIQNQVITTPIHAVKCIINNNAINQPAGECKIEGYDDLYFAASKIQETYMGGMYGGNQIMTYSFTLSKDDFNNRSIGMYMIYICNWNYAPSISIYMVAYSGGLTTQSTLTKIAGADANISLSDGVVSYSGQGYISISAIL